MSTIVDCKTAGEAIAAGVLLWQKTEPTQSYHIYLSRSHLYHNRNGREPIKILCNVYVSIPIYIPCGGIFSRYQ
jgi:hypothetical protein